MSHSVLFRVYYEDTDAGGVIYYANYLKFAERARTEYLRTKDIQQEQLRQTDNILFVVKHVTLDLHKPARLDDLLEIITHIEKISGAQIIMHQEVRLHQQIIAVLKVQVVCVTTELKVTRIPALMKEALRK